MERVSSHWLRAGKIRKSDAGNCSGRLWQRSAKWLKNNKKDGLAGEPGFEPRLTESESVVLPLNYSPAGRAGECPGRCAALINKSGQIANTDFEKNRCRGSFLAAAAEKLESCPLTRP